MPFDVLGRTCATLKKRSCNLMLENRNVSILHDRASFLQFWMINEEFQVGQSHHLSSD